MRLAHARPATVTLVAGSVLATAASGVSLTLATSTAANAATTSTSESCEPLPQSAASAKASPAPTRTLKSSPSATATTTTRAIVKATATKASTKPTASAKPTPTPTKTPTQPSTPTATNSHNGAKTVDYTQPSLCVKVAAAQSTTERGQAAKWTVSEWTAGGKVSDATVRLQATPASGGAPAFSLGCGSANGTSACDLGAIDANSAPRQLAARLTVPVTASAVTAVNLTVLGSAPDLANDPTASAAESITAPPASSSSAAAPQNPGAAAQNPAPQNPAPEPQYPAPQNPGSAPQNQAPEPQNPAPAPPNPPNEPPVPADVTSPLPVGNLPSVQNGSPTLRQGGNAGSLFPTLKPARANAPAQPTGNAHTRPVADTSALPEGAPVVGAQLAGLAALAVAFVLAVARLSIRRHPGQAKAAQDSEASATAPPPAATPRQAEPPTDPPAASADEANPGA